MDKCTYNSGQRRALNIVWNTAQNYQLQTEFLAFLPSGEPDFYLNCIIGLAGKWYDRDQLTELFHSYAGDARQAELDALVWLALENAAYERECPDRPVLKELRRQYAMNFFDREWTISRQQWMAENNLLYTQRAARWRAVLGQQPPMMLQRERELAEELSCPGTLSSEQLIARIREILRRWMHFDGKIHTRRELRFIITGRWAALLARLMPTRFVENNQLRIGASADDQGGNGPAAHKTAMRLPGLKNNAEQDRTYIEECFGRSIFSDSQMAQMERTLCTGHHSNCHIWFTRGEHREQTTSAEARQRINDAREQGEKNRRYYTAHLDLHRSMIRRLSERLKNCIQVHREVLNFPSRRGRLNTTRVWRQVALQEDRVFTSQMENPRPEFSVDLLLDASASRLNCQEVIAAQGTIIARSLQRCGIPVQVSSFCDLRGYTVLRLYHNTPGKQNMNILDYFAAGWNRDGLALRCAGALIERHPEQKHLLLILTDASPNASRHLPSSGKLPLSRDYADRAGIEDTAAEVQALRAKDIQVLAVFTGEDRNMPAARTIYGKDLVRIRQMDRLADAVGTLLGGCIRQLEG